MSDQSIRVSVRINELAKFHFVDLQDYDGNKEQYVYGLPEDALVRACVIVGQKFRTFRSYFLANSAYVEEIHQRLCRKGPHQFQIELVKEDGTTITITSWGEFCREIFGCHPSTVYRAIREIQRPEDEELPESEDEDQEEETDDVPKCAPPREPAEMIELRQELTTKTLTARTLESEVKWYREMLLETWDAIEKLGGDRVPLKLHDFIKNHQKKLEEHERNLEAAFEQIEANKQRKALDIKLEELEYIALGGKSSAPAKLVLQ